MATTSTDVELETRAEPPSRTTGTSPTLVDQDDVAEASRIADAGVPEGGYGWYALAACGVICFWFVGTTYSWGVLQDALVASRISSASTLAYVGSLTIAFIAFLAIVNAKLLTRIGSRATAFCGIAFLAAGEVLSGFAVQSVAGLFVTTGVVMGIGVSLCFIVVSTIPAQYFSRKRGLANGIVFASGGLGGASISFMMNGLIQHLGVAWTFHLIGIITCLTGLPAAYFVKDRVTPRPRPFIEWQLFKDFRFVFLFMSGIVATFPLLVPPFFLPLYSNSIGLASGSGTALVAAFNFASAVGRIGAGFLSDHLGPLNTLFGSLLLSALSMLVLWPISTTLGPLVAFAIINGAANGGFFALMPTVAGQVFGSARVSIAMGMLVTGWSGGYLMGAPIAGYLLAAYGGESAGFEAYRPAIYYAGTMSLGAAGLVAAVRLRISTTLLKKL